MPKSRLVGTKQSQNPPISPLVRGTQGDRYASLAMTGCTYFSVSVLSWSLSLFLSYGDIFTEQLDGDKIIEHRHALAGSLHYMRAIQRESVTLVMLSKAKHLGNEAGNAHPRPFARQVGTQGDNAKTLHALVMSLTCG